jgi:hypothetical protein
MAWIFAPLTQALLNCSRCISVRLRYCGFRLGNWALTIFSILPVFVSRTICETDAADTRGAAEATHGSADS